MCPLATLTAHGLADANVIFSAPPGAALDPMFRRPQLCQNNPHPARPRYPPPAPRTPRQPHPRHGPPPPTAAHPRQWPPATRATARPHWPPTLAAHADHGPPGARAPHRSTSALHTVRPAPTSSDRPVPRPQQRNSYPARPPPPSAASAGPPPGRRHPGRPPGSATPQPPITQRARPAARPNDRQTLTLHATGTPGRPNCPGSGVPNVLCRRQPLNPERRLGVSRKLTGAYLEGSCRMAGSLGGRHLKGGGVERRLASGGD